MQECQKLQGFHPCGVSLHDKDEKVTVVTVVANVTDSTEVTALAREGREMPEQALCL